MSMKHMDQDGVKMVDVGDKEVVKRIAIADGKIFLNEETIESIENNEVEKGNVLTTAQIAGTLAVKKVPELIPMCHSIPITSIKLSFTINDEESCIKSECKVKADYKTGVEMEALTGVNISLLTIWDMVKSIEKDESGQYPGTRIKDVEVKKKRKL